MKEESLKKIYITPDQLVFSLLLTGLFYFYLSLIGYQFVAGGFGAKDLMEYYGALKCLEQGLNPYLFKNQTMMQNTIGWLGTPVMMWNPPWLVALLRTILKLDIQILAVLWLLFQLFSTILSCYLVTNSIRRDLGLYRPLILIFILLVPLLRTLAAGQIGGFLCLFSALTYASLCKKHWFFAGLIFSLCSVKPHLVLIGGIFLVWWAIYSRTSAFLSGLTAGFFCQILLCLFTYGSPPFLWWLDSFINRDPAGVTVVNWIGVTVPQLARYYFGSAFPIILIVFGIIVGRVSIGFSKLLRLEAIDWQRIFPPVISISVLLALYGWLADFLMIMPLIGCFMFRENLSRYYMTVSILLAFVSVSDYFWRAEYVHSLGYWPITFCILSLIYFRRTVERVVGQSIESNP